MYKNVCIPISTIIKFIYTGILCTIQYGPTTGTYYTTGKEENTDMLLNYFCVLADNLLNIPVIFPSDII